MNIVDLLRKHNIAHTADRHTSKHVRRGWVQVKNCPWCGSTNYHLGICINTKKTACYKCGKHRTWEVFAQLAHISAKQAIRDLYESDENAVLAPLPEVEAEIPRPTVLSWPIGAVSLRECHRAYLRGRKYDADKLEKVWKLRGTLGVGDYAWRIILPYFHNGAFVSYQARDITRRSSLRYRACSKEDEVIDHKKLLYGEQLVPSRRRIVVVEGGADAWRLGPGAVATSGTSITSAQLARIAKYKEIYLFLDSSDAIARENMQRIAATLCNTSHVEILTSDTKDPGEMKQKHADALMRDLGFAR